MFMEFLEKALYFTWFFLSKLIFLYDLVFTTSEKKKILPLVKERVIDANE